ncbi:MAG: ABC transporter permease [Anaerolineaceae bacterium]
MKRSNHLQPNKNIDNQTVSLSEKLATHNGWLVLFSLLIALGIWSAVVNWGNLPAFVLPSPVAVWNKFLVTLMNGSLLHHSLVTLSEVLAGLLIGSCLATLIGYWLSRSIPLEKIFSPFLVASQAVPTIAIAPLLIIWFGSGMASKVLICALTVFFPILVNTIIGFRAVPANLKDLMRSLHPTRWQMLKFLEIPSALPILFGGLRIGATLSVIGAIVGEFVGSDQGLGFLINVGRGQYDMPLVFVSIGTLIALALCLYGITSMAETFSMPWKKHH